MSMMTQMMLLYGIQKEFQEAWMAMWKLNCKKNK